MDVALYHPAGGYYARGAPIGARGDYYTSVAAHPAFGALIALQLLGMWGALGRPSRFDAVEVGAGTGLLARDVAEYARQLPTPFRQALRYTAIERSPSQVTRDGRPADYQWIVADQLPARRLVGCVLSNELLDSLPVHRIEVLGGAVKEVYVTLEDGRFVEALGQPSTPTLERRAEGLELREGQRGEVNMRAGRWAGEVAGVLDKGFVLTVDYGYELSDRRSSAGAGGTVETYYRHTRGRNPYERVGSQDITAHVDFSSLIADGRALGLNPVGLCTQAQYLHGLGLAGWLQRLRTEALSQRERDANMMALRELLRADGLGGFKVLVQEKDTGVADLGGLVPLEVTPGELPFPLLRGDHTPLFEGRYPHSAWRWEDTRMHPDDQG